MPRAAFHPARTPPSFCLRDSTRATGRPASRGALPRGSARAWRMRALAGPIARAYERTVAYGAADGAPGRIGLQRHTQVRAVLRFVRAAADLRVVRLRTSSRARMRRTLYGDGGMLAISTLLVAIVVSSAHGQRYLTIDSSVIETTNGLEISLGPVAKDPANPLFGENRPWEAAWWNTYPTVAYDASTSKFKMWYNSNTDCSCKRGLAAPCSACNTSNPGMCPHLDYANSTTAEQRVFGKTLLNGAITAVMYAESVDGRSWVKPSLGLVNFRGSTANNMCC